VNDLKKQVTSVKISNQLKLLRFDEPSKHFRDWIGSKAGEIEKFKNGKKYYCVDNVNCYTADELGKVLIQMLQDKKEG
jgi:hypothetical protein